MRRPQRVCRKVGCNKLTREKYCEAHQSEKYAYDKNRPSSALRGYDHTWRKLRKQHLNTHPLCRFCSEKGIVTEATEVDHIQTIEEAPERRLDPSNLRSLCKPCHSKHTYWEQGLGKNANHS